MVTATLKGAGLGQTGISQTGITQTLEDQYTTLRNKCIEQYGANFCNAVMPRNMVYALTGQKKPWWMWMIAGYLVAKILK